MISHQLLASTQEHYHKQVHLKKSPLEGHIFSAAFCITAEFQEGIFQFTELYSIFNRVFIYNVIYGEEYNRKYIQPTKHIFSYL